MNAIMSLLSIVVMLPVYTELVSRRAPFIGTSISGHVAPPAWPRINATAAHNLVATSHGAALLAEVGSEKRLGLFFALEGGPFERIKLALPTSISEDSSPCLATHSGNLVALATSTGTWRLSCVLTGKPTDGCTLSDPMQHAFGPVRTTKVVPTGATLSLWLATAAGLFRQSLLPTLSAVELVLDVAVNAIVHHGSAIVVANADKVWDLDAASGTVLRWDWVSISRDGQDMGGMVDGSVSSLASGALTAPTTGIDGSADTPTLFIGTPSSLSVRTDAHGYQRIGADQGLPVGNISALALCGKDELWIGTSAGVAIWTPGAADPVGRWRYLYGPRWLVSNEVRALAPVNSSVAVLTEGGVTWVRKEEWTLAAKAAAYERVLTARHVRHGLTAECTFVAFGAPESGCISSDNDNNGLWTSLVRPLSSWPALPRGLCLAIVSSRGFPRSFSLDWAGV